MIENVSVVEQKSLNLQPHYKRMGSKRAYTLYIYILLALFISITNNADAQNNANRHRIYGHIKDALSGESLPYASIRIRNKSYGCSSDNDGNFSFYSPELSDTLIISSLGYKEVRIPLSSNIRMPQNISMQPERYELKEVTIKPKKEKYSRKNNPAVTLVETIIKKRDDNSPEQKPFYSRDRHEKLSIALNNFDPNKEKHFGGNFSFLNQYIDTSLISGKPILHVLSRELLGSDYYQKSPKKTRQYVKARRRSGIDDMLSAETLEAAYAEVFKDVDIFKDNISIFSSKFVSPLSKLGTSFYRYYLMDTVRIDGEDCIDLAFTPFNSQSFGFTGHIYVTNDSTFFIKLVQMNVPHDINMNFVDYLNIRQEFSRLEDGTRILNSESLIAELKVINAIKGFYANRHVEYNNYSFEPDQMAEKVLAYPGEIYEDKNSTTHNDEYWADNRIGTISEKELSIADMMKELRNNPLYYWTEKCVSFLFTGWVPIRENRPPLFYGPVNTTVSYNALEGVRLRVGAMSSAYLNPHLFGRFYVAYGIRDHRWKYMGELEYSFKEKKEHPNEFPIHSLRLHCESDIYQYGQNYLFTNKDNFILSLKRQKDDKLAYARKAEFTYTHELHNHFSYALTLRHREDICSRFIPFDRTTLTDGKTETISEKNLLQSEVELFLRYAPKEKFTQSKWNRYPMNPEVPVFSLSHRVGFKGIAGCKYNYHHTEAGFSKRFWFSAFGYTDCVINAGKVWNKVPFPLLIIPNANLSYTIQDESFALMNAMEFFNDQYVSWYLTYYMNGLIFNRIPYVNKLNIREVISFRGFYGHLSKKNRPNPSDTGDLFLFPGQGTTEMWLGKTPYMEIAAGIENIFKVLRIDYVYRLTYRDRPGIDKHGIRIKLHVQF